MILMFIKFLIYTYVLILGLLNLASQTSTVETFQPYDIRQQELPNSHYNDVTSLLDLESTEFDENEPIKDEADEILDVAEQETNEAEKNMDKEEEKDFDVTFTKEPIGEEVASRIVGVSWKEEAPVSKEDLAYLQLSYWGYDDQPHHGEMIVHNAVADDILEIFQILYENRYPIERMKLIDEYDADDNASMRDNNTSSFCYRSITNSSFLSKHSYGLAIDINPLVNPYVSGNHIYPIEGAVYKDRQVDEKGMIQKDDILYQAFIERGWIWGGDWEDPLDYQHFEKPLEAIQ
ncbi:M15 family metallopeptidase [Vallitalea okinawensis]|uniref:M15 family metallopeptidase n=1 Tax=Vallitalea okinawensis TaxID=2078660 RepID=UPI0014793862|nr:M15 family metallopeptidase [Vallitalea okinawensis]